MDLFVINRHTEDEVQNENTDEKAKIAKFLKKIQKNKEKRRKAKENAFIRKGKEIELKHKTIEQREKKRQLKAKLIPIPERIDDFVDKNVDALVLDDEQKNDDKINKKHKVDPSSIEGFTILGLDKYDKKTKVKRVLPRWLTNPTIISINLQNLETKVSDIKQLDKTLKKKLKKNGIKYFFPVQAKVIPWLLEANKETDVIFPRDICVSAPTGSGKTLAFVLPIIQALKHHTIKKIRALVILPTQDLAMQVFKAFKEYSSDTNLDICLISNNNLFANEQRMLVTKNEAFGFISKIDILICTAGRLVDHLKLTPGFDLKYLEFLVIDEADRVLDVIQNDWLYHLQKHIESDEETHVGKVVNLVSLKNKRPPQKLLFSATLSQDPEKLQKLSLFQPKLFTSIIEHDGKEKDEEITQNDTFIGKYTTPKELTEKYIVCSIDLKPLVLYEYIKNENLTKTIIFTNSIESSHRLSILLKVLFKEDRKIEELSSGLRANHRNDIINKFTSGDIDLLVCTDTLARGMDLIGVKCIISYSAPKYLKTYIHRAGRTARAGLSGLAVTLLQKNQLNRFLTLLKQAGKDNLEEIQISEDNLEPLGEIYKEALNDLKKTVNIEDGLELKRLKMVKQKPFGKRKRNDSTGSK